MKASHHGFKRPRCLTAVLAISSLAVLAPLLTEPAWAQEGSAHCLPVSERTGEIGCWILASEAIGQPPSKPLFWYLDTFPSSELAEKAKEKEPRGTVIRALGQVWLLTIAEAGWHTQGGERVAQIGPLPVSGDTDYVAQYMEAIMTPGMETHVHRHPGPEAWYTEHGQTCLESPQGKQVGQKGVNVIVPGGEPMKLTVTGTEQRRSLVLVLYDATQPWMTMASDWTAKGLCGKD